MSQIVTSLTVEKYPIMKQLHWTLGSREELREVNLLTNNMISG